MIFIIMFFIVFTGVFSYNVDDLKLVVERNTAKRRREMLEAEGILRYANVTIYMYTNTPTYIL